MNQDSPPDSSLLPEKIPWGGFALIAAIWVGIIFAITFWIWVQESIFRSESDPSHITTALVLRPQTDVHQVGPDHPLNPNLAGSRAQITAIPSSREQAIVTELLHFLLRRDSNPIWALAIGALFGFITGCVIGPFCVSFFTTIGKLSAEACWARWRTGAQSVEKPTRRRRETNKRPRSPNAWGAVPTSKGSPKPGSIIKKS